MYKHIKLPLDKQTIMSLKSGDMCYLSGIIYTARDAAHKRLTELVDEGKDLPFDIRGACIYYAGPSPARPGEVTGSIGPTTSYRMDAYAPKLIRLGLGGMIGKGMRSQEVRQAMKEEGAVYFGAIGGCGALISKCVVESEIVCYEDLGAEAVRRLRVKDFPVTVIMDAYGGNLYETGRSDYLNAHK